MQGIATELHDSWQLGLCTVVQTSAIDADDGVQCHCFYVDVFNSQPSVVTGDVWCKQPVWNSLLFFVGASMNLTWLQWVRILRVRNITDGCLGIAVGLACKRPAVMCIIHTWLLEKTVCLRWRAIQLSTVRISEHLLRPAASFAGRWWGRNSAVLLRNILWPVVGGQLFVAAVIHPWMCSRCFTGAHDFAVTLLGTLCHRNGRIRSFKVYDLQHVSFSRSWLALFCWHSLNKEKKSIFDTHATAWQ